MALRIAGKAAIRCYTYESQDLERRE